MAAIESAYGDPETLVITTDALIVQEEPLVDSSYLHDGARRGAPAANLGRLQKVPMTGLEYAINAVHEATGFGAAYTASDLPSVDTFMRMCGMGSTVDVTGGSETVTYAPLSSAFESGTMQSNVRGQKFPLNGVFGSFTITSEDLGVPIWEFALRGRGTIPVDEAIPSLTYLTKTIVPPKAVNVALQIGDFTAAIVRSWSLTQNLVIGQRIDQNSDGHGGLAIGRREPVFECTIEANTLKTSTPWHDATNLNPYQLAELATGLAFSLTVGSVQYNKWGLTLNNCQLLEPVEETDDEPGNALWTLRVAPAPDDLAANNDLIILFD